MVVEYLPSSAASPASLSLGVDGDAQGADRKHRNSPPGGRDTKIMLVLVMLAALLALGFFGLLWLQISRLDSKITVLRYQVGLAGRALALVERRGAETEALQDSLSEIFVQAEKSMRASTRKEVSEEANKQRMLGLDDRENGDENGGWLRSHAQNALGSA